MNISKITKVETGLPGRPKAILSPRLPKTVGMPGWTAIFSKCRVKPASFMAAGTKSKSPAETPPGQDQDIAFRPGRRRWRSTVAPASSATRPRSSGVGAGFQRAGRPGNRNCCCISVPARAARPDRPAPSRWSGCRPAAAGPSGTSAMPSEASRAICAARRRVAGWPGPAARPGDPRLFGGCCGSGPRR